MRSFFSSFPVLSCKECDSNEGTDLYSLAFVSSQTDVAPHHNLPKKGNKQFLIYFKCKKNQKMNPQLRKEEVSSFIEVLSGFSLNKFRSDCAEGDHL